MSPRTRPAQAPAALSDRLSVITFGNAVDTQAEVLAAAVAAPDPATLPPADAAPEDAAPASRVRPDALAERTAAEYGVDLAAVIRAEKVTGRAGEVTRVPVQAPEGRPGRFLLIGTGSGTPQDLRRAGAALARAARGRERVVTSLAEGAAPDAVRALAEGLRLGGWVPPAVGTRSRADARPAREIVLTGEVAAEVTGAVERGSLHALTTARARDLAVTPSSVKTPDWLAGQAASLAGETGLDVRIWTERELAADGFGGILAVGAGSGTPPRLVRLDYRPDGDAGVPRGRGGRARAGSGRRPVVLVGKGITFDTGGLSIKPREAMVPMKTDMSGAAAVLAALAACRDAGVTRPVTGLLALAENAVGASSYRPGDVVTHYGGRTVEVANTDAEGRMVLADALAYADAVLDPEYVVDLATLTGAATLALGRRYAALFTPDDDLAAGVTAAGTAAGENVWRLPLVEDYRPAIDSSIADLRHVTADGHVGAGAVVAALFLREFTGGRRWAHLDIAGPARSDKDEYDISRGGTGFGARLLLRWLEALP